MKRLIVKTSGQGEPLLVLHGWGMNSGVWQAVKEPLQTAYCITWVDLPGHGLNRDIEANSLADIVNLIMPLITHKTHVLGWSLGGLIAQAMVQSSPQTFRSLTLVASTPRFSQGKDWQHAMSHQVLDQFAGQLAEDLTGTLKRFIALQFMGVKHAKDLQRSLVSNILQNPAQYSALKLGLKLLKNSDYRHYNSGIPQHWILAGRDRLVPLTVNEDLQAVRPADQISVIPDAGHAPFMTHPDEFMSCVNDFLTKQESPYAR